MKLELIDWLFFKVYGWSVIFSRVWMYCFIGGDKELLCFVFMIKFKFMR